MDLYLIATISIITLITVLTRAFPFLLFGKRPLPPVVKYLSDVLPASIMIILVVYCLKGVNILTGTHGIPELISCLLIIGVHLWKKNMYLSIIVGTLSYMALIRLI